MISRAPSWRALLRDHNAVHALIITISDIKRNVSSENFLSPSKWRSLRERRALACAGAARPRRAQR
jgi:hypothetical protein